MCYRVHPGGDGRDVACGVAAGCLEQHYFKIKKTTCVIMILMSLFAMRKARTPCTYDKVVVKLT